MAAGGGGELSSCTVFGSPCRAKPSRTGSARPARDCIVASIHNRSILSVRRATRPGTPTRSPSGRCRCTASAVRSATPTASRSPSPARRARSAAIADPGQGRELRQVAAVNSAEVERPPAMVPDGSSAEPRSSTSRAVSSDRPRSHCPPDPARKTRRAPQTGGQMRPNNGRIRAQSSPLPALPRLAASAPLPIEPRPRSTKPFQASGSAGIRMLPRES